MNISRASPVLTITCAGVNILAFKPIIIGEKFSKSGPGEEFLPASGLLLKAICSRSFSQIASKGREDRNSSL